MFIVPTLLFSPRSFYNHITYLADHVAQKLEMLGSCKVLGGNSY